MSSKDFWALTWWDFNLWVYRILELQRKRKEDQELNIELTRSFMTLFANANRDSKTHPEPFEKQEFFKLSYDEDKKESKPDIKKSLEILGGKFPDGK